MYLEFGFRCGLRLRLLLHLLWLWLILLWQEITQRKDVAWIQMLLGCGIERCTRLGDSITIPMTTYLAHAMMMGQRATAGEDLLACTVLNGLENLHRIGYIQRAETKVEVNACTGIVGLCDAAGNGIVLNVALGTLLKKKRISWNRIVRSSSSKCHLPIQYAALHCDTAGCSDPRVRRSQTILQQYLGAWQSPVREK